MLQELMLRIRQLETHVKVLQRASKEENPVHHVALTIMYLGHDYTGYDDTEEVEHSKLSLLMYAATWGRGEGERRDVSA
ncbi:hypothetical protein MAR_004870 [Mya arenaria]|uniref:Uncharacterized protein n=1 Tax=Mya arenaria TaxID=6604 RepID=A0ABY7EXU4_MYAAR|nr:hypothetical protein MAR_029484 [Mya arenaria]WAR14765.1 hypothetical protein MAR_004870 [Mya arenaria]